MSAVASLYAVLNADASLTALLTGGLYALKELPGNAFNQTNCSDAWDANTGVMKPVGVLKGRAVVPQGRIADLAAQVLDTRQVIEIYLYADRDAGRDLLTSAAHRIYALLQGKYIAGAGMVSLTNTLDDLRAPEYADACMMRLDYTVEAVKTAS